jgi:hypothetical protein
MTARKKRKIRTLYSCIEFTVLGRCWLKLRSCLGWSEGVCIFMGGDFFDFVAGSGLPTSSSGCGDVEFDFCGMEVAEDVFGYFGEFCEVGDRDAFKELREGGAELIVVV